MAVLKPCPICGGGVMIGREDIFCDNCHLSMKINDRWYNGEAETYEEAREQTIEAWNTRKPMEEVVAELEEKLKASEKRFEEFPSASLLKEIKAFEETIEIVRGKE